MEKPHQIFQAGVKGIFFNPENNKVLILLKKGKNIWDIPGGRIDEGEKLFEALDRELKEEITTLKEYKIIGVLNASIIERVSLMLIYYKIEADLTEIGLSEEHASYRWVSLEEIDELEKEHPIDPGIKEALKMAFSKI
jgi:8-oxo-dGTP diphosphatase